MRMLLQHVEHITPDALESSILKTFGLKEMCALLKIDFKFVHTMQGVRLNCTNSLAENVISVHKVIFIQKKKAFCYTCFGLHRQQIPVES